MTMRSEDANSTGVKWRRDWEIIQVNGYGWQPLHSRGSNSYLDTESLIELVAGGDFFPPN
jgi:hypothetical protein